MISADHEPILLDDPLFPLTVGAEAARANHSTYRMYANAKRAPVTGRHSMTRTGETKSFVLGSVGSARGTPTLLSLRGVLTYAAATALIKARVPVAAAQVAALAWTTCGSDDDYREPFSVDGERAAAGLYAPPLRTFLIMRSNGALVTPVLDRDRGWLEFAPLPWSAESGAIILVMLDDIHDHALEVCNHFLKTRRTP